MRQWPCRPCAKCCVILGLRYFDVLEPFDPTYPYPHSTGCIVLHLMLLWCIKAHVYGTWWHGGLGIPRKLKYWLYWGWIKKITTLMFCRSSLSEWGRGGAEGGGRDGALREWGGREERWVTLYCTSRSGADTRSYICIRFRFHLFGTHSSRHQEIPILHNTGWTQVTSAPRKWSLFIYAYTRTRVFQQ